MTWRIANFDVGWLWSLAGWTMLHFLWAGLVLLLFAAAGRQLVRRGAVDPLRLRTWLATARGHPADRHR